MIDMKRAPKIQGAIENELEALEDKKKEEAPAKKETAKPYWLLLLLLGALVVTLIAL